MKLLPRLNGRRGKPATAPTAPPSAGPDAAPVRSEFSVSLVSRDGLPASGRVRTLAYDHLGYLLAGTNQGLFAFNGVTWRSVALPDSPHEVRALLAASDGSMWVGTSAGLLRLSADDCVRHDRLSGMPDDNVTCLLETTGRDGAPVVWVGTQSGGLGRFDRSGWSAYGVADGMPSETVSSLVAARSASGNRVLWIGTPRGLARFERTHWTVFDTASGLPCDQVLSLHLSVTPSASVLWVGTARGLVRSERRRWYPVEGALGSARVVSLVEGAGAAGVRPLWVSAEDLGVFRLDDGGCHASAEDLLRPPVGMLFGAPPGSEPIVFAATCDHIAVVEAGTEDALRAGRPLVIERVLLDGAPVALGDQVAIPSGGGAVTFEFSLLAFIRGQETRYRTKLAGFEKHPSDWTSESRRSFIGLAQGAYELRVWARDWAGVETGPVRLAFKVVPPRGRKWLSMMLYAGAAAGFGYGAVRYGQRPKTVTSGDSSPASSETKKADLPPV